MLRKYKTIMNKDSVHSLGIGLLQQSAPELIPLSRLSEDQLVVEGWDAVVNDNINPVSIAPELNDRKWSRRRNENQKIN